MSASLTGNLGIVQTVIRQAGKTGVHQAKERIGGEECLPYVRRNDGSWTYPVTQNIASFKSGGIFASGFTKGQVI